MTRVDFYVLSSGETQRREYTACRLAEKAWRKELRVFVHTASREQAKDLDNLLWVYRQDSFVPHCLDAQPAARESVLIGDGAQPNGDGDVLINLTDKVPPFFARFERVIEIVGSAAEQRQAARDRYRAYREQDCELQSHTL